MNLKTLSPWMAECLQAFKPPTEPKIVNETTLVDAGTLADWTGETEEKLETYIGAGVIRRDDRTGLFPLWASLIAITEPGTW